MKRDNPARKTADAYAKILEGEVALLPETIESACDWDRPSEVRAAICRIRNKAEQIAAALDVNLPKTN